MDYLFSQNTESHEEEMYKLQCKIIRQKQMIDTLVETIGNIPLKLHDVNDDCECDPEIDKMLKELGL